MPGRNALLLTTTAKKRAWGLPTGPTECTYARSNASFELSPTQNSPYGSTYAFTWSPIIARYSDAFPSCDDFVGARRYRSPGDSRIPRCPWETRFTCLTDPPASAFHDRAETRLTVKPVRRQGSAYSRSQSPTFLLCKSIPKRQTFTCRPGPRRDSRHNCTPCTAVRLLSANH